MASEKNKDEMYFEWWLIELQNVGLVLEYEREPKAFELREAIPVFYDKFTANKPSLVKNFNLFQPITYTTDYRVVMSMKLVNKLFGIIGNNTELLNYGFIKPGSIYEHTIFYASHTDVYGDHEFVTLYFDVKPPAKAQQFSGKLGSSRDFPYNRRMVWDLYKININKVVVVGAATSLYNKTFMPRRYLYTDGQTKLRRIKGNFATLEEYLTSKEIEL